MNVSGADGVLWAAGFVGHLILLAIMFFGGRSRVYPVFTAFITFSAVRTVLLFSLWRFANAAAYTDIYWGFVAIDTSLQLALIWEIAGAVFSKRGTWAREIWRQLMVLLIVSIVGTIWLTRLQVTHGFGTFQMVVLKSNYGAAVLMSALFAGMIALSSRAYINWKSHVAAIATGMAVYSFSGILIEVTDNLLGFGGHGTTFAALQTARKVLYLACVTYWSYSLSRAEPPQRQMSPRMEGQLSALRDAIIRGRADWGE